MVWAIIMASDYNEFFPRGGFRGYDEALAAHYGTEYKFVASVNRWAYIFTAEHPLDTDGKPYGAFSTYAYNVSEKFHSELGVRRGDHPPLGPVEPHEWPEEYVFKKIYKRPAAIVEFHNRMFAVDEALRDILERLEPGVHTFHPIRTTLPDGSAHPVQYHMMVVGRWLSSFRLEESDPRCLRVSSSGTPTAHQNSKEYYAGIAMSASEIGDAHLWRERRFRSGTFFISDQLRNEVLKAGLRLPQHFRMKSVAGGAVRLH